MTGMARRTALSVAVLSTSVVLRSVSATSPCRLWLAPSHLSTEKNLKFGLFAGIEYAENDTIPHPELAFPFVDFNEDPNKDTPLNRGILEYLEGFMWTADYAGAKFEGNFSTNLLVPGIGVLANYHSSVVNVDWVQGAVLKRERPAYTQPGVPHPARGAVTPYYNMTMRATQRIKPGMELFANYGVVWDRDKEDVMQDSFTRKDYTDADKVLNKILDFMNEFGDEMDENAKDYVLDFMLDKILAAAAGKRGKVIKSLIPAHPRKLQRVHDAGGTFHYRYPDLVKSPTWLDEHGLCVDKLRSGISTIPEAGRGAFATRDIKEGEIIAPVPMIPMVNEDLMDMYRIDEKRASGHNKRRLEYDRNNYIGQQIMMNYCFGHDESSMLLFPVAPMVSLVNHASLGYGGNAYLSWSTHEHVYNDHSLHDMSVADMQEAEHPIITMNLVAWKDIKEGEEVFLDYGQGWVDAYAEWYGDWIDKHDGVDWPLKAEDVALITKDKPYPYDLKQSKNPYPANVVTACYIEADDVPDGTPRHNAEDMEIIQWVGPRTFEDYVGSLLTICDIMEREGDSVANYVYTVYARIKDSDSVVQINEVPHAAITLIDRPYTGDMFADGVFRHWISVGDQRWPMAWRNLRE